jgi:hypothetical protein
MTRGTHVPNDYQPGSSCGYQRLASPEPNFEMLTYDYRRSALGIYKTESVEFVLKSGDTRTFLRLDPSIASI